MRIIYEVFVSWAISTLTWLSIAGLCWYVANVLGLA